MTKVILVLASLALASTSEPDPIWGDYDGGCSQDFCAYYNDLDEADCYASYIRANTESNCTGYVFQPGPCETDENTGCTVQNGPSYCDYYCPDAYPYPGWWPMWYWNDIWDHLK